MDYGRQNIDFSDNEGGTHKCCHIIPTLALSATMLYYFSYYVNFNDRQSFNPDCYAAPWTAYGDCPVLGCENLVNVTQEYHAINAGGVFLALSHLLSTLAHICRPLKGIAKFVHFFAHLITLPWFLTATIFRFRQSGVTCASNLAPLPTQELSQFAYIWIITWWVLGPVLMCLAAACFHKNRR